MCTFSESDSTWVKTPPKSRLHTVTEGVAHSCQSDLNGVGGVV